MPPSIADARAAFAATAAEPIARQAGTTGDQAPIRRGQTTTAVWFEDDATLTAVVGPQEGKTASLALAHGLHLAGDRALRLVLPAGLEGPTLYRAAWLDADVAVWTHGLGGVAEAAIPTRQDTLKVAGGPVTDPDLHLGDVAPVIGELAQWAALHPNLQPAHRRDVRAWTCRGMRVLTMRRTRTGDVALTAGIDAAASPALKLTWTHATPAAQATAVRAAVETGIVEAQNATYGPFEEHHLQEVLRLNPHLIGLEHPVVREIPAFRPSTGPAPGRGYIDLAGLDGSGDLVLVETKLGSDDMLILQGLDYWIWASRDDNRAWLNRRLHADPARSRLTLLYAVGGRMGAPAKLDKYAQAQLRALPYDVRRRVVLIDGWKTAAPTITFTAAP